MFKFHHIATSAAAGLTLLCGAAAGAQDAPPPSAVVHIEGFDDLAGARATAAEALSALHASQAALRFLPEPDGDLVAALEEHASRTSVLVGDTEAALRATSRLVSDARAVHALLRRRVVEVNAPAEAAARALPRLEEACTRAESAVIEATVAHGERSAEAQAAFARYQQACDEADSAAQTAAVRVQDRELNTISDLVSGGERLVTELERGMARASDRLRGARAQVRVALVQHDISGVESALRGELDEAEAATSALMAEFDAVIASVELLPEIGPAIAQMQIDRPQRARSVSELVGARASAAP